MFQTTSLLPQRLKEEMEEAEVLLMEEMMEMTIGHRFPLSC